MTKCRALIAYDGTTYHGWARQAGGIPTVQGVIEDAIATVVGSLVQLTVAGRTDAGVHAWGQVASFEVAPEVDLDRLRRSVDAICGPAISIRELSAARPEFNARFDAVSRRYVYRILTEQSQDPFCRLYAWHIGDTLDIAAMREACGALVGEHDFASFCKADSAGGTVRRLESIIVDPSERSVDVWFVGSSFCHQMVRSLIGFLVDVGRRRRPAAVATEVLHERDRQANSNIAPPHGLTLWTVEYGQGASH